MLLAAAGLFIYYRSRTQNKTPVARKKGKAAFIDKTGTFVIAAKFDDALSFDEHLAPVQINGKWGYIDKTGAMALNAEPE
jgi:hypothetical protein